MINWSSWINPLMINWSSWINHLMINWSSWINHLMINWASWINRLIINRSITASFSFATRCVGAVFIIFDGGVTSLLSRKWRPLVSTDSLRRDPFWGSPILTAEKIVFFTTAYIALAWSTQIAFYADYIRHLVCYLLRIWVLACSSMRSVLHIHRTTLRVHTPITKWAFTVPSIFCSLFGCMCCAGFLLFSWPDKVSLLSCGSSGWSTQIHFWLAAYAFHTVISVLWRGYDVLQLLDFPWNAVNGVHSRFESQINETSMRNLVQTVCTKKKNLQLFVQVSRHSKFGWQIKDLNFSRIRFLLSSKEIKRKLQYLPMLLYHDTSQVSICYKLPWEWTKQKTWEMRHPRPWETWTNRPLCSPLSTVLFADRKQYVCRGLDVHTHMDKNLKIEGIFQHSLWLQKPCKTLLHWNHL